MAPDDPSPALARVYAARDAADLRAAYADWAGGYDRETLSLGYHLPFAVAAWVARHVPPGAGPLLDVGCGTGLAAPLLAALGHAEVEGLDASPEMLEVAGGRGYARLHRATLGEPLPLPPGRYACAVSAGTYTEGHAPAASLRDVLRLVRPGGLVILSLRDSIAGSDGFLALFEALAREGLWRERERSAPFRAFLLAHPEVLVRTWAFEALQAPAP